MARLGYGQWTRRDGSLVLFNRSYTPFAIKETNGEVSGCRHFWVDNIVDTQHFWVDGNMSPKRCPDTFCQCLEFLEDWGLDPLGLYLLAHPLKPSEMIHIGYRHDDWCALLNSKGNCNCNPDVEFINNHLDDLVAFYNGGAA